MVDLRGQDAASGAGALDQQPDLLAALRRQWMTILVAALVGTVIAWVVAVTQATVYESQSTLLLVAAGDEQSPGGGRDRTLDVDTWATVARSTDVLQQVADDLGRTLSDVRSRSTSTAAPTGDTMILTFEAGSAQAAVAGATTYSERFLATRDQQVNQSTITEQGRLEALGRDLETQIQGISDLIDTEEAKGDNASPTQLSLLTATQEQAIDRLAQVNTDIATLDIDAETGRVLIDPGTAVSKAGLSLPLTTLAGLMLGMLIGLIVALLRDRYDDRYDSAASPGRLGVREVARVPYRRAGAAARANAANAYSRLITRLTFARRGTVESGRAVLLLPVDSESLPDDVSMAVANSLAASADLTGILIEVWEASADLEVRPGHWADTLDDVLPLRDQNDLVLVPVLGLDRSAAGIGLAALVDDTVLLVAEATPMQHVIDALDDLRAVDAPNVHVVVVTGIGRQAVGVTAGRSPVPPTTHVELSD